MILAMTAGVRLIQNNPPRGSSRPTFSVTTLRNDGRLVFATISEARRAFKDEVKASKADPRVGPYVR